LKENGTWQFNCQHGANECWGNLYHACLIDALPRKEDHFPIIQCIMSYNINIQDACRLCSDKYNVSFNKIQNCMSSSRANVKMHNYADMTARAHIGYTPWMEINSQYTTKGGNNLIEYLCSLYKGPSKPFGCFKRIKI
jgi:interferon gamma-inducible protein 30